ncbi:transporter [Bradyrhizobium canariense]|uniref:Putative MetA-pathway of phenol degradation n=1 Tax=Bradyrhizobium canariense TaxID=255045 RepID=A0A1H2AMQ1_9BRAD|nr:transporter [Bradyrhizobium canariense]SDT47107.1 Putative MetA-pathway of phenol degradation [Bradyrhizobium canariense]
MSGRIFQICLPSAFLLLWAAADARADACPTAKDEIATDRPDVTNSSLVVPVGSLQNENGVNLTARDDGQTIDGTNSRWRLGVAPCLELLVDLPTYFANVRGPGSSGFADVSPAIKWQVSPVPGKIDLSLVFGAALPTGAASIAGRGAQPYVQMPWSWELQDGWGLSGMFTEFFHPSDFTTNRITETTFAIEKKIGERASLFVEYVGDYPEGANPSQFLNSGGLYRLTPTQQVDFHVALGLNRNSPSYIAGIGYSFRLDGLFAGLPR